MLQRCLAVLVWGRQGGAAEVLRGVGLGGWGGIGEREIRAPNDEGGGANPRVSEVVLGLV
jgi:hypothetical protein